MSNSGLVLVDEVTEEIANNLTDSEKQSKILEVSDLHMEIVTGLSNPKKLMHKMMFSTQKEIFTFWSSTLKQLHFLGKYEKPVNTICTYIKKQIGQMRLDPNPVMDLDKKENMYRNVERNVLPECKQDYSKRQIVGENTSDLTSKESIILEAIETLEYYHLEFIKIIKTFRDHIEDPLVHQDMEKWFDRWEKIARLCEPLSELSGDFSILKQMAEEGNMREMATMLQKAMAKLLYADGGFRQMAHGFGVVPRQNQRIRNRMDSWPEKDPENIFRNVTLSLRCQGCGMHIITGKRYNANGTEIGQVRLAGKKYKLPKSIRNRNLSPIDVAELFWKDKLLPIEESK